MKEKVLSNIEKLKATIEDSKMFLAYCQFKETQEEDEKLKADWRVKADTYEVSIQKAEESIKDWEAFANSL